MSLKESRTIRLISYLSSYLRTGRRHKAHYPTVTKLYHYQRIIWALLVEGLQRGEYGEMINYAWDQENRYGLEVGKYDLNGNIEQLLRFGMVDYTPGVPPAFGVMDDLSYTYQVTNYKRLMMVPAILILPEMISGITEFVFLRSIFMMIMGI